MDRRIPDYLLDHDALTTSALRAALRDPRNARNSRQNAAQHLIAATTAPNSPYQRDRFAVLNPEQDDDGRQPWVEVDSESLAAIEDEWKMWVALLARAVMDGEGPFCEAMPPLPPHLAAAVAEAMLILCGAAEQVTVERHQGGQS